MARDSASAVLNIDVHISLEDAEEKKSSIDAGLPNSCKLPSHKKARRRLFSQILCRCRIASLLSAC
eukprot:5019728-Pleurochrysis_carterae.AAC.3